MEWVTVKEAGELWGMTTSRAKFLCANGKVDGAQKQGIAFKFASWISYVKKLKALEVQKEKI